MTGTEISLAKYVVICLGIVVGRHRCADVSGSAIHSARCWSASSSGVGGPHFVIGKMIKRRVSKFTHNFPDAIELMVRGLRSGLPITETLGIVASEIPVPSASSSGRSPTK